MRAATLATVIVCLTGAAYAGVAEAPTAATPRAAVKELPQSEAHESAVVSCERMWDRGTHMTKKEWLQTCRRVQNRLQQLEVR